MGIGCRYDVHSCSQFYYLLGPGNVLADTPFLHLWPTDHTRHQLHWRQSRFETAPDKWTANTRQYYGWVEGVLGTLKLLFVIGGGLFLCIEGARGKPRSCLLFDN